MAVPVTKCRTYKLPKTFEIVNHFRDAILVSLGDFATSVFAGFVIFATIGVMAKEMGTSVADVISSGNC
jgi:hypothetical protein